MIEDRSKYAGLSTRELWFWLSSLQTIGPVTVNGLLNVLGSPEGIWETDFSYIIKLNAKPRGKAAWKKASGAAQSANKDDKNLNNKGLTKLISILKEQPASSESVQMNLPAPSESVRMNPPASSESVRMKQPASSESVRMKQPASSESVQMNLPAPSESVQMNSPVSSDLILADVVLKPRQLKELCVSKKDPAGIAASLKAIEKSGIRFIGRSDVDFPAKLLQLPDCPPGLFLKGRLPHPGRPAVAVIGARECDEYGRQMADYFGSELAKHGIDVISGMAIGVDGRGQRAALRSGGYSLAVLGCGVDICYPRTNFNLYETLIRQGGVVSEFLPGASPSAYRFPRRNRLISAFADAVVVIEAREKSGSLITADQALEQGRDVMAVPGRIGDLLSEGCNQLIRQGAAIATCIDDVIDTLGVEKVSESWIHGVGRVEGRTDDMKRLDACEKAGESADSKAISSENDTEKAILSVISSRPTYIDAIAEKTGLSISELMHVLLRMELRGLVAQPSPGQYVKVLFPALTNPVY